MHNCLVNGRMLGIYSRAITIIGLILVAIIGCTREEEKQSRDQEKPNIVLIISDDQSWTDYSFMGHADIETPNIDKLASESLTFTRGYLASPLCRPSLATLATGLYPHQHGITGNDPEFSSEYQSYGEDWYVERAKENKIFTEQYLTNTILPERLSELGYRTIQTGKWWEGSWKEAGFTSGMTHADPEHGGRHGDEGLTIGREGMQPIEDFMDEAKAAGDPFFVWYAPFLPHTPHTPPDSLLQKYNSKTSSEPLARYWAMCEWFDITVGQLQSALDERGLTENTLIVYIADNGWVQNPDQINRYIKGSKRAPYDLGIRTPIMLKWPGHTQARMDTTTFLSSTDIMPTIVSAAGGELRKDYAGIDVIDKQARTNRSTIFSEDFAHDMIDLDVPAKSLQHRVILEYPWKLIVPDPNNLPDKEVELFNIMEDPSERDNLATEKTEIRDRLLSKLNERWTPGVEGK